MTINISDNNPRITYSIAEGVTQQVFSVPFEYFDSNDVIVYVDGVVKYEGIDFTILGGDGSTGTITFNDAEVGEVQQVTGAAGGTEVTIVRRVALERVTDFPAGSDINRAALNTQLDTVVAQVADMNDRVDRGIHLNEYEVSAPLELPSIDDRKGRVLSFDPTTGGLTQGPLSNDVQTIADNITGILDANNQATTAATSATAAATSAAESETARDAAIAAQNAAEAVGVITEATATASNLPAGSSATASVTVTNGTGAFSFGIPAGAQGIQGIQGVAGVALGWTGGSYNGNTGVVTFTSDDGLGFSTDDLRPDGALLSINNLIDLDDVFISRDNLGLGTSATTDSDDYATAAQGLLADSAIQTGDSPSFVSVSTSSMFGVTNDSPNTISLFRARESGTESLVVGSQLGSGVLSHTTELNFATGVTTQVTIDSAGNTGFGTQAPTEKIDVVGNIAVSGNVDGRDLSVDGAKLDGIEAGADVTDTANVTAAGALMDSEVTNLSQVKAFASADYATAAQGTTADSAVQPNDSPTFNAVTATSYAGDGSALTGLPAGYTDADVDTHLNTSTAANGEVLSWTGTDYDWIAAGGGGGGGGITYTRYTANVTIAANSGAIADTSGGSFTVTLPASPSLGDIVVIADGADWGTNNLTVARNGSTIEGTAEDLTMDIGNLSVTLIYDGNTWQVYAQAGASEPSVFTASSTDTLTNKTISGAANTLTVDGTNPVGYLNLPPVGTKTSSYTLQTADVGKYVQVGTGGSITIPNSTFAEGDAVSLFNNTTGNVTVTCSIATAYVAGVNTDVASVTLAPRGVANVLFISPTVCVITGNVS